MAALGQPQSTCEAAQAGTRPVPARPTACGRWHADPAGRRGLPGGALPAAAAAARAVRRGLWGQGRGAGQSGQAVAAEVRCLGSCSRAEGGGANSGFVFFLFDFVILGVFVLAFVRAFLTFFESLYLVVCGFPQPGMFAVVSNRALAGF